MIEYRTGDIFGAEVEALVNNRQLRRCYGPRCRPAIQKVVPDNFKAYAGACKRGEVEPGRMFITERLDNPKFIINFPTKRHWRGKSRMDDIESGLEALACEIR